MGITINTNVNALLSQQYLSSNNSSLGSALNRLSSGLRINSAKDDAAGLAISQHMQEASRALRQGSRNANDGVSLVQTAETAMEDTMSLLQRMREIASQASSGTYQTTDLANLDKEFQSLKTEVGRIASTTTFNGVNLLNGSATTLSIQVGNNSTANDRLTVTLTSTATTSGGGLANIASDAVTSNSLAQTAMNDLDTAISTVTTGLAQLGANEGNLDAAVTEDSSAATNVDTASSRITDADFAVESTNLAKYNILTQSSMAMLSQANSVPGMVLKLLS